MVKTQEDPLQTRLSRLQWISESGHGRLGQDLVTPATMALRTLHESGGRSLEGITVRDQFLTRRKPPREEISDRRPPKDPPPPVVDLISPNGISQQMELVALFVAQTQEQRHRDRRVTLDLPLEVVDSNAIQWLDIVVPHSTNTPEAVVAASRRDNRLRQVKRALDSLSQKGLVDLPGWRNSRGKYDDFQLLDEGGIRPHGGTLPYRVPLPETGVTIPIHFYLNGWVYALSKSEIALWLMIRHLHGKALRQKAASSGVSVSGAERVAVYAISRDAYRGWPLLARAGLIDVEVDPNRRADGTVVDFNPAAPAARHRFRLTDEGLAKPAAPAMKAAIAEAIDSRGPLSVL